MIVWGPSFGGWGYQNLFIMSGWGCLQRRSGSESCFYIGGWGQGFLYGGVGSGVSIQGGGSGV